MIKRKVDGLIDMYEACLVAKGFKQQYGINYVDTFSYVVKNATITLVWIGVHRVGVPSNSDVQNASFQCILDEEVFMKQPLENEDKCTKLRLQIRQGTIWLEISGLEYGTPISVTN